MKKYLCTLFILAFVANVMNAQTQRENLREKLINYYQSGKTDMKNQTPGSFDIAFGQGMQATSKDSTSRLNISFRFQTLFHAQKELNTDDKMEAGFLIRRSRLKFDGFAFTPNLQYKVELGFSNRDISPSKDFDEVKQGSKIILDAVVKWKFHKNFTLWAGQTKLPGNRERVFSSQKLQFVDRSLVNSYFNLDRDMAVQLHSEFKAHNAVLRAAFAISTGDGRNITAGNIGGFGYTGRVEFLPMGKFTSKGDYFGADLKKEEKPKLSFGFSYDYNQNTARQFGRLGKFMTDENDNYITTDMNTIIGDMLFKYKGLSIMSEIASRDVADKNNDFASGTAVMVAAGYVFDFTKFKNYEIAMRYTKVNPHADSSLTETSEYTFGVSKYVLNHNLKIQTDVSLVDVAGQDNMNIRYRLQTEFAF